jgi:large subunit ribosomal protein L4
MAQVKIPVLNWSKKEVGEVSLPADVIKHEVRKDILQVIVTWQLACRRQGTHKALEKGEVRGGGKKPFKQKGTGNARQGSIRSPLMPGGGVIFGPKPRDYSYALPKKLRQAGIKIALSHLNNEGKFFVVKDMTSKDGKSKELSQRLKTFGLEKALLVASDKDDLFKRAARNLKNYRYTQVDGLNVYDLLKYDAAVITESSLEKILSRCGEGK